TFLSASGGGDVMTAGEAAALAKLAGPADQRLGAPEVESTVQSLALERAPVMRAALVPVVIRNQDLIKPSGDVQALLVTAETDEADRVEVAAESRTPS